MPATNLIEPTATTRTTKPSARVSAKRSAGDQIADAVTKSQRSRKAHDHAKTGGPGFGVLSSVLRANEEAAAVDKINLLWAQRKAAIARCHVAEKAHQEAESKLPWWAAPGPGILDSAGEIVGEISNWPARINPALPLPKAPAFRYIRRGLSQLRDEHNQNRFLFGSNPSYRASFRKRVREWIALRREQIVEEEKVGIPAIEAEMEAASGDAYEIYRRILGVRGLSPAAITSRVLFGLMNDANGSDKLSYFDGSVFELFEDLRPHLVGTLADCIDEFLAHRTTGRPAPLWSAMSFWH